MWFSRYLTLSCFSFQAICLAPDYYGPRIFFVIAEKAADALEKVFFHE